jgi:hypothetical protein
LLVRVQAESGLGSFQVKLAGSVEKAQARTADAATLCGQPSLKKTKKRLQQAGTALAQYAHRLASLAARRQIDRTLRQGLIDQADPIRTDLKAFRTAVRCPDAAPPG